MPPRRASALGFAVAVAMFAFPVAAQADAATYYVAPDGADTNPGTADEPFATIANGVAVATSGDTVLVRPGRYAESVSLDANATGVTIQGEDPANRPVVDGAGTRPVGISSIGASKVTLEGLEVTGQTRTGMDLRGEGFTVSGNYVHHVGSAPVVDTDGIVVRDGGGSTVTGNVVNTVGPGSESHGIYLYKARDTTVEGNSVYLSRKDGVRDRLGLGNVIRNNRAFLNWTGLSLNQTTGATLVNNYVYDNTQGIEVKHTSVPAVLTQWGLATPQWSRVWHNTVYRSNSISIGIALSDAPLDYLDVRDNLFVDAAYAHIRDVPSLRGSHVVVDGNSYLYPAATKRPTYLYKAGWSSAAGISSWATFRSTLGWEASGQLMDPLLNAPGDGDLDYGASSPAAQGSLPLDDELGTQLGARRVPPAPVRWVPYPMKAVDSSSKGTYTTKKHLAETSDDNQQTYWSTATNSNEFAVYDVGQPRTLDHLVLTVFGQGDKRTIRGYRVEVSDDRVNWRTVLTGVNPDPYMSSYKYELAQPETARYLRFTMIDTFCKTYTPRTGCGAYFLLADLKAGLLERVAPPTVQPPPEDPH